MQLEFGGADITTSPGSLEIIYDALAIAGEVPPELCHPWTGAKPAGAQAGIDLGDFRLADLRRAKNQERRGGWGQ